MLVLCPMVLFTGVWIAIEPSSASMALLLLAPYGLALVSVVLLFRWSSRRKRRLEDACAAAPPAAAGQPARCRVCGGPLETPAPGAPPIVRCGFCAADNLAAGPAYARASSARRAVLESYAEAVRAESRSLERDSSIAVGALLSVPIALPFVWTIGFAILYPRFAPDPPPDESVEYVLLAVPSRGACVARVNARGASGELLVEPATILLATGEVPTSTALASSVRVAARADAPTFSARALEGRAVRLGGPPVGRWRDATVLRAIGTRYARQNELVLRVDGGEERADVLRVCLPRRAERSPRAARRAVSSAQVNVRARRVSPSPSQERAVKRAPISVAPARLSRPSKKPIACSDAASSASGPMR
ncbi:MAG: hypothetical protein M5U28_56400 [Sandaracinaceae bacterium]|nr:hypothetical protein [Sandaracinaceae bacterium]